MAREVIADLDFNQAQASTALKALEERLALLEGRSGTAARSLQSDWNRSGNAFVTRMFSMRTAAVALLGSFSVAGIILGLKNLVQEASKASVAFEKFSAAASVSHSRIIELLGSSVIINKALAFMGDTLMKVVAAMEALGKVSPSEPFSRIAEEYSKALGKLKKEQAEAIDKSPFFTERLRGAEFYWDTVTNRYVSATRVFRDMVNESNTIVEENIIDFASNIDAAARRFEALSIAAQAAGAAIGNALFTAGTTAKQALASILKQIATIAITQAFMHAAAAYASTTLIGAAATGGTPAQHKAAALFWAKVAVFAGAGALAAGGRESAGGGGSRGGFAVGQTIGPASAPTQVFNFSFDGAQILGTSKESLMNEIVVGVKQALKRGVGGGSLDFSTEPI